MSTIAVNAPKTPVTKGSNGIAAATIPNVCKMPGPPPPFVPTPLPNIGQSSKMPKGYSTTVKFEGQPVAIKGASFGSSGDIASKGSGGGIVSSNAEGPTKFVGPGSMDTKIEGKNVQLLGDQMLNNCGPAGSPANSATMGGVLQAPLEARGAHMGVLAELQEICDIHCDCVAQGDRTQNCIDRELYKRDTASEYTKRTKSEVPYNMKTRPPTPYMSKTDPRRQTRNWRIKGSRRPDAVIVNNPREPWSGDNIAALVECKWGKDRYGRGQEKAYETIAGDAEKVVVMDDSNCHCPSERQPDPLPVPVKRPVKKSVEDDDRPLLTPAQTKTAWGAVAACAAIATAALLAPEVAVAAAAVVLLGKLSSVSTRGEYDGV